MTNVFTINQTAFSSIDSSYEKHCRRLLDLLLKASVTTSSGRQISIGEGTDRAITKLAELAGTTRKAILIGNGGSAAIAGHQAIDWTKNAGIRAVSFNDGPVLTCLGNDYGYENVFSEAIKFFATPGDILVAISSSGKSPNIINGVNAAKEIGCLVFTFAGFDKTCPLLSIGDLNFYVDSSEYGPVEVAHQALLHYLTDMLCERRRG
jgi:D-sedoheptulose 7-phosphate isomerase